jgi:hypothetical protein
VLCKLSCFDFYFEGFLCFTCGVSDLVGRRIANSGAETCSREPLKVIIHIFYLCFDGFDRKYVSTTGCIL